MINDNGLALDIEALVAAASETDVLIIGFEFVAERVVIDFRADRRAHSRPLLELVEEPMADAEERLTWLAQRRPALAAPEHFLFFVWPHSTNMLTKSPVAERILTRFRDEHGIDYRRTLDRVVAGLRRAERAEQLAAVRGSEGFETIWSRRDS